MTDFINVPRETLERALEALSSSRIFVTTKEKIKHPEGTEWYDEITEAIRALLDAPQEPTCSSCKHCAVGTGGLHSFDADVCRECSLYWDNKFYPKEQTK